MTNLEQLFSASKKIEEEKKKALPARAKAYIKTLQKFMLNHCVDCLMNKKSNNNCLLCKGNGPWKVPLFCDINNDTLKTINTVRTFFDIFRDLDVYVFPTGATVEYENEQWTQIHSKDNMYLITRNQQDKIVPIHELKHISSPDDDFVELTVGSVQQKKFARNLRNQAIINANEEDAEYLASEKDAKKIIAKYKNTFSTLDRIKRFENCQQSQ